MKKLLKIIVCLIVLGVIVAIIGLATMPSRQYDGAKFANEDATEKAASVERGRYVAITGDCQACHHSSDNTSLSGGYGIETPFGTIFASNITPDKETGIGNWSEEQFANAVRNGKGPNGPLYPAMPYTSYVKMSDQDIHDLWNYIKTLKPVHNRVVENQLPFPFNIRYLMLGWNRLFFDATPLANDNTQSEEWNRGRYLAEGAAHCSMCHTPRNNFGAEQKKSAYHGAVLQNWFAPAITNDDRSLANWSKEDLVTYLKTGRNRLTVASGPMSEAVVASFQNFNDKDLNAVATYIKSLQPQKTSAVTPLVIDNPKVAMGKRIYFDNCAACHVSNGKGIPNMIPAFAGNNGILDKNTESMIHVLLAGSQGAITKNNPTAASMPGFAWRLTDREAAAVLTYIRNSWGNGASPVDENQVKDMRKALKAPSPFGQ